MPELDSFDARLTAAVRAFADRAETGVDATAVAERTIRRRRAGTYAWLAAPLPVPAWIVLVAGLLLAALLGATMIGGAWRDAPTSVVPPVSPDPSATAGPTAAAARIEEVDLSTVTARALPPAATCPAGTDPDAPGPAGQAGRPSGVAPDAVAFDRQSGRIVVVDGASASLWTFDVCRNVWSRWTEGPSLRLPALVYDADSDRTIAFGLGDPSASERVATWSHDLDADRWVRGSDGPVLTAVSDGSTSPWSYLKAAYHDPSGLVVVYDGTRMWAYDVETDRWFAVRQQVSAEKPAGVYAATFSYDVRAATFVAYAWMTWDGPQATLTFDPTAGTWRRGHGIGISGLQCSWVQTFGCAAAFDAATGMTIRVDRGRVDGWDAAQDAWTTLNQARADESGVDWCTGGSAFDTLNSRMACLAADGGVAAFSPSTRQWQWLLEPQE